MRELYLNPYREKAEQGDVEAQYQLGLCYYKGEGENVIKDFESAVHWFRKAAEQDYALGQFHLGVCYLKGNGVSMDAMEGLHWVRLSAERNCADAQGYLGFVYILGQAVGQDWQKAFEWSKKAAENGDATGQYLLGVLYKSGQGVTQNSEQAVKWYRKAAEQDHAVGQHHLGQCYAKGEGVEKDEKEAVKWFRKAAEQGHSDAQNVLGDCYLNGHGVERNEDEASNWHTKANQQKSAQAKSNTKEQDYIELIHAGGYSEEYWASLSADPMAMSKRIDQWEESAKNGDIAAQFELVWLAEQGLVYDLYPDVKAEWLTNAAEHGIGEAQEMLAEEYKHGGEWPMLQNSDEAEKWYGCAVKSYHKESEEGDEESQYRLGNCYFEGRGIAMDKEEAVKWFRKAAEQGHSDAQNVLGDCYLNGHGVEVDNREAWIWHHRAAQQFNQDSIGKIKKLFSEGNLIGTVTTPDARMVEIYETAKAWYVPAITTTDWPEGIRISRTILQCEIPIDQGIQLIETGKTNLLSGFVSKRTKRAFSAYITFDQTSGKISFEFEPREAAKEKPEDQTGTN